MRYVTILYTPERWRYILENLSKYDIIARGISSDWTFFKYIVYIKDCNYLTNWGEDTYMKFAKNSVCIEHSTDRFISEVLKLNNMTKNEFTKDNLKSGMVVITRNKMEALVVNDLLLFHSGFEPLSHYTDDLVISEEGCEEYDIVKVYAQSNTWAGGTNKSFPKEKLLWDREGVKEYTMQEIADKLGIPVEQLRIRK